MDGQHRLDRRFRRAAVVFGIAGGGAGAFASPRVAFSFALGALATTALAWIAPRPRKWVVLAAAAALGIVGGMTDVDPETTVGFLACATALGLATSSARIAVILSDALVVLVALLALVVLFGHTYSAKFHFGVGAYTQMTAPAAIGFLFLALAIFASRPDRGLARGLATDGPDGFLRRRLYPIAILLPLALGTLTLAGERARYFNGKFGLSLFALATMTLSVALIAVTLWSFERAENARRRLAAVLLEEDKRRGLARELHDEVGQHLTAIKLRLATLARKSPSPDVTAAQEAAAEAISRVSSLSLDLRPAMLDDLGLLPALMWLIERFTKQTGIEVQFTHEGINRRFSRERETAAFRIVQEALSNVARHANTTRALVRVSLDGSNLRAEIEDHGAGFHPAALLAQPATGGLLGMHERALALGGRFTIDAAPGRGARVRAELPEVHP